MSQVRRGTTAFDDTPFELVNYPSGGVFVVGVEAGTLGAQNLTISAYTRAHEAAAEILAKAVTISGAAPVDPSVAELQIVTSQPVRFEVVLSTGTPATCPWWIESKGQVATIEDGEGTTTADGTEQTLVTSLYPGTFMLLADLTAMQGGDTVKLRLKTLREGSYYTQKHVSLSGAQSTLFYEFGPLVVPEKVRATLQQTAGTNRSFPRTVVRVGS